MNRPRRRGAESFSYNQDSNATINLDESDKDSIIVESPVKIENRNRRSKSEDSIIFIEKKTQIAHTRKRQQNKKSTVSTSVLDASVIIEEPRSRPTVALPAAALRKSPDLETDYMSLNTGLPAKRPRLANGSRWDKDSASAKASPPQRKRLLTAKELPQKSTAKHVLKTVECVDLLDGNTPAKKKKVPPGKRKTPLTAKRKVPAAKKKAANQPSASYNPSSNVGPDQSTQPLKAYNIQDDDCVVVWDSADVLCVYHNIAPNVAKNLVNLFDNDNTIPFIARYRRGLTNNMEAEQLRAVRDAYEELKTVKDKAKTSMKKIQQLGKMNSVVRKSILAAKTVSELDEIMVSYKPLAKGTHAERARNLGLEKPAMALLNGDNSVYPMSFVVHGKDGLNNVDEVQLGLQHIIAEVVSKHELVLDLIRHGSQKQVLLKSARMRVPTKLTTIEKRKLEANALKFKEFFNYSIPVPSIRSHTAMALNRGEKLKILSIKISPMASLKKDFMNVCSREFNLGYGQNNNARKNICDAAILDAWERLIIPAISRQTRAELTKMAEKESLDVFASNLKQILLMPPLKGATVLGIDPGFVNGCKIAVVSPSGEVKQTDVIYPPFTSGGNIQFSEASKKLLELVKKFKVRVVALGDGTASSETSVWLGQLMEAQYFHPAEISYTIVGERGASIYSCSPEAKEEFPEMDPNVISAVSIARRLQEPLAELVKVDPKHLGVGMYQHDLPDAKLKSALDEVVQECVSFVGVDLNTASLYLLRKVAGLNQTKAKCLLEWRNENGPFTSRKQLLEVKGIGPKAFEQCAGFVRVIGSSRAGSLTNGKAGSKVKVKMEKEFLPNILDSTNVHPEAYNSAVELVKLSGARLEDLGKPDFKARVNSFVEKEGAEKLHQALQLEDVQAVLQLAEALTQGLAYDIRVQNRGPIFRQGFSKIEDLQQGETFIGSVQNVTPFGAFVDIGVGTNGLLHVSQMGGQIFHVNDRVDVKVINIDIVRKRIGLALRN